MRLSEYHQFDKTYSSAGIHCSVYEQENTFLIRVSISRWPTVPWSNTTTNSLLHFWNHTQSEQQSWTAVFDVSDSPNLNWILPCVTRGSPSTISAMHTVVWKPLFYTIADIKAGLWIILNHSVWLPWVFGSFYIFYLMLQSKVTLKTLTVQFSACEWSQIFTSVYRTILIGLRHSSHYLTCLVFFHGRQDF